MGGPRITDFATARCRLLWSRGESIAGIARKLGISTTAVRSRISGLERDCRPPCEEGEEWARIDEVNSRYFISSHGRAFTNGDGSGEAKLIDVPTTKGLRSRITLCDGGIPRRCLVDRLVAEHFCEGHGDGRDAVAHVDGDTTNNRADNLMWVEGSEPPAKRRG